jgi:phosphoglucomutase
MMENIRNNPPKAIAGRDVLEIRDYLTETITNTVTGEKSGTGLPVSNVLYFRTEGENVVVIRPSGTEPKIKLYLLVNGACEKCAAKTLEEFKVAVADWTK